MLACLKFGVFGGETLKLQNNLEKVDVFIRLSLPKREQVCLYICSRHLLVTTYSLKFFPLLYIDLTYLLNLLLSALSFGWLLSKISSSTIASNYMERTLASQ